MSVEEQLHSDGFQSEVGRVGVSMSSFEASISFRMEP